MTDKALKGGTFLNRYVIRLALTALTPFHIGSGQQTERDGLVDEKKNNKKLKVNAVVTDGNERAYIPGSTLRGALRDWLRQGNAGMTEKMDGDSADDIAKSSDLERIFGTQHNEGKLEVWDAYCTTSVDEQDDVNGQMCFWNKKRMTYVAKSVTINPETGTAEDGKLYNYELVPKGASFTVTFSAQNLGTREVELVCAVLNGFEHEDNPIAIGAMTKLDYGRFKIGDFEIYCYNHMDEANKRKWREIAVDSKETRAGYDLLIDPAFDLKKINKADFDKLKASKLPEPKPVSILREEWTLKLETPLVVRSGGHFVWKNAASKKTRNYRMEFDWKETDKIIKKNGEWHHVSDLYHSVEILWNEKDNCYELKPYYHIPSSSVRGALRNWTIKHLLSREWWDIEDKLKEGSLNTKPQYLDNILTLFGFAIDSAEKQITEAYTRSGRLIIEVAPFLYDAEKPIEVAPFLYDAEKPKVDGEWNNAASNNYGPKNAQRHVKPQNPLDRITHAAKDSGLHHNLEFSKEQKLVIKIKIIKPNEFDKKLLGYWKDDVLSGMIRLGGLASVGRGRLTEFNNAAEGGSNV
jgi:CRISPR/Cas system CSM-associated protein Csm3 (group 7 of RAMP superfamily)